MIVLNSGFARRYCWLFTFLLLARVLFAAIPIQDRSVQGAAAADARLKVIAAAESCLGVPYRYAGLDRRGIDCSGLVFLSFREALNVTIPRTAANIFSWSEKINVRDLVPGDLVFFVTGGSAVSHVGIYTGDGKFIHSASDGPRTGVIYSDLDEAYWKRTFIAAGRALPWDESAARAMAAAKAAPGSGKPHGTDTAPVSSGGGTVHTWNEGGFFTGAGAAWTWGGFFKGSSSVFRGLSALAMAGYKWQDFRIGLELRPEFDRALGIVRLPITLSMGTDIFQVFAGPAYTFGEPVLEFSNQKRRYEGGSAWLWEAGISAAFPPIRIGPGALSLYGELAWQPYRREGGEALLLWPDINANVRISTGLRFLWIIK